MEWITLIVFIVVFGIGFLPKIAIYMIVGTACLCAIIWAFRHKVD